MTPDIAGYPIPDLFDGQTPKGFPADSHWVEKEILPPVEGGIYRIRGGYADQKGFVFNQNFVPLRDAFHPPRHTARGRNKARTADIDCRYLKRLKGIPTFDGDVVSLSSAHTNYYHWLFEILGRYRLAEEKLGPATRYYANNNLKFQAETLQILNVPDEKLISPDEHPIICAENLIVPFYTHYPNRDFDPVHIDWLHRHFGTLGSMSEESPIRLYVSRAKAPRRRVANESELMPILEDHGFKTIYLKRPDLAEQISLFARAEAVIAPHGAGLTNLLFVPQGCKVIELFPGIVTEYYHKLAIQMGGHYTFIRASEGGSKHSLHDDFTISRDLLMAALKYHSL